jgi:hypothetical protein
VKNTLWLVLAVACAFSLHPSKAQTTPESVKSLLTVQIQASPVTTFQLQQFLARRIPHLPSPGSAGEWSKTEEQLRTKILNDVVYHGWPQEWISSAPKFEEVGVIDTGHGYRRRKLRWEIVPGFWSTAILYEPEHINGKGPAILDVIGHFRWGKAEEDDQKRCINFAKRGILTLNLEWIGFGELFLPEDYHNEFGPHLNLAGVNNLGLFYFAMRRGLDYLERLPNVDPQRIGMTGLSGGGWQTVVLGALDPRVSVAVEVAGLGSLQSNILHPRDTDEAEQNAPDIYYRIDYPELVAMRAPRPTLLVHNAEDDCCYRSMLVKPYIYDNIKPFFALFDQPEALAWHENVDPSTHNYQLDNRQQAYGFFTSHFNLPVTWKEVPSSAEIKSAKELEVGLPADNLTILGLARRFAARITRPPIPTGPPASAEWSTAERKKLVSVIRYDPAAVEYAWRVWNSKNKGVETLDYRFDFGNGLSATGVWLESTDPSSGCPAAIVLSDDGREATRDIVSDRLNRGQQVLALDLIFHGEMLPQQRDPGEYEFLLDGGGVRPLGLEVAQLLGVANWLRQSQGSCNAPVEIETNGFRSQVIGLVAAAIDPNAFSLLATHAGVHSLNYVFDVPVPFTKAPELFCLDFYKEFDLAWLIALAEPTKVRQFDSVHAASAQ